MCSFCCPARDHSPPVCAQGRRRRLKHPSERSSATRSQAGTQWRTRPLRPGCFEGGDDGIVAHRFGGVCPRARQMQPGLAHGVAGLKESAMGWAMATVSAARTSVTAEKPGSGVVEAARKAKRTNRQPSTSCRGTSVGARLPIGVFDTRDVLVSPRRCGGLRARDRNPHGPRRRIVRSSRPARRGSVARRHFAQRFFPPRRAAR